MRYIIYFYDVVEKGRRWYFREDKTERIEAKNDAEATRKCKRRGGSLLVRSEPRGKPGKKWYKRTVIYGSRILKSKNYN